MVLRHPEGVIAPLVHALGVLHNLVERAGELLFGVAALVDRHAGIAEVFHVDGAVIRAVEFRDHRGPRSAASRLSRTRQIFNMVKAVFSRLVSNAPWPADRD